MNKYSLLIFDLDGTVCDTDEMIVQTWLQVYKIYKPKVMRTREELYYFSGPSIYDTVRQEFPDYDTDEVVAMYRKISDDLYNVYVKPFENEIETLKALKAKGYLLGINTNRNHPLTDRCLKIVGLENIFDVIMTASEVDIPKPNPDGVFKAMKALNIQDKSKILYVGDNDIDYYTANGAGVDSMLVIWGPRKLKCVDKATYTVKSYNEIGEILL